MIPDNVTLIVKAPNQQVDDQNVECQSSWTVRQLKGHLSQVYPSKPGTDDQKIIYSGKLLDDHIVLKDVLRTYESEIAHTMHLVCSPKRRMVETSDSDGLRRRTVPNTSQTATSTQNVETETPVAQSQQSQPIETPRAETRQNDQNHTVEMQNYLSSYMNNYGRVPPYPNYTIGNVNVGEGYLPVPNDPTAMANHMMMMQQAYIQYMQQYANMWQPGAVPTAVPPTPETPAAPPAPPAQEDDEIQRDWLEHLYAASRLALLCSLVYLYGSPARLLLVLFLAAAGYLHQIGFFRDLRVNLNRNQPQAEANRNEPNIGNAGPNNPNAGPNNPNVDPNNPNAGPNNPNVGPNNPNVDANPNAGNVANDNENQSLLAVTWMIFSTFFASLIPDMN